MKVEYLYQWEKVKEASLKEAYEAEDLLRRNNLDVRLIDSETGVLPYDDSKALIEVHVRKIHGDVAKDLLTGEISHVITKAMKKQYFEAPRRINAIPKVRKRYGGVGRYIFPLMIFVALLSLLRMVFQFAFL